MIITGLFILLGHTKVIQKEGVTIKKYASFALTVLLTFGAVGTATVFAMNEEGKMENSSVIHHDQCSKGDFKHMEEFLLKKAKELGIETAGKDNEAIYKEIRHVLTVKHAKELGISTDGKDPTTLRKEVWKAKQQKAAKELGIDTTGKDSKTLAKEIREIRVTEKAKELGIETDGKELCELMKEVREKQIVQTAEKLGIDTKGKSVT